MSHSIINTDTMDVHSTHETRQAAEEVLHDLSTVSETFDGRTETNWTTFGLSHRVRNDATGNYVEVDDLLAARQTPENHRRFDRFSAIGEQGAALNDYIGAHYGETIEGKQALDALAEVFEGDPMSEEDAVLAIYGALEMVPDFIAELNRDDLTYSELLDRVCARYDAELNMATINTEGKRAVRFVFADEGPFDGFTDDTRWNGFLNIWVTPEVHAKVIAETEAFHAENGVPLDESAREFIELEPGEDGLVSYAGGYVTSEYEADER